MVAQSPVEQFSWNSVISNFVGKHDSPETSKGSEDEEPKLELEIEEGRSEANEGESSSEVRDEVDCSQPQSCTPFDEPSCVPFDERSCTPRTTAEMKMDLNNIREDIAEIVKEHKRVTGILKEQGESPRTLHDKCVHFSLDCNPEAVASKEEGEKPVMERKDDTLEYIFNLVEIAICGEKKSNLDEDEIKQKPSKKEQMPDPVQLLREKSIFQTLNPGTPSKSRKRFSRSQKSGETSEKSGTKKDSAQPTTVSSDDASTKRENTETSSSETIQKSGETSAKSTTKEDPSKSRTVSSEEASKNDETSAAETTKTGVLKQETYSVETVTTSKHMVSTTEARELRALRLKAASPILKSEVATTMPGTPKPEAAEPAVPKNETPKANKKKEAVSASTLVPDVSAVGVPPTIPEEPSNSQESASSQDTAEEEKKKFVEELVEELAQEVLAEVLAMEAETDESASNAPQSSVHVDVSHDSVSLITHHTADYSHSLPRIIHLSDNSESKQTKPTKPSNIYSPSIRKLQNRNSVSAALAAYNKKVRRNVNFGGSTRVLGKQGSSTTTLARRNNAGNEQIVQLLAGLLAMGKSNKINAPGTPRGVIFLASVVSFLFWPEDLPKNQMVPKSKSTPKPVLVKEPAEKKEVPSLLSLVGDKKPKMTPSPVKRNRPRPQISSRRINASKKKSFDV